MDDAQFDAEALAIIRPSWADRDRYATPAAQVAALRDLAGRLGTPAGVSEHAARELTVYPPNVRLYDQCETCGQVRWVTERRPAGSRDEKRSLHCGCCAHPHDLPPGGHELES